MTLVLLPYATKKQRRLTRDKRMESKSYRKSLIPTQMAVPEEGPH